MLDFNFKENAPALLLVLATVILMVTFSLPVGGERRRSQTRYQSLNGFVGAFAVWRDSAPAQSAAAAEPLPRIVPPAAAASSARSTANQRRKAAHAKLNTAIKIAPSHAWPHLVSAQTPSVIVASVEKSSVTESSTAAAEKPASAPSAAPAKPATETADFVAESYENDPSKYPMDRSAAQGPITMSLCGLSRQKGRYFLKVAVTNNGNEDFFVKELSVRDGRTVLTAKSFFRLFIESGRTREGFVVFEVPRAGADVHVALKEDREKGRVVELPVPYSF
jgi:hypothetical protein